MTQTQPQPSPLAIPDAWNAVAAGYTTDIAPFLALYAQDAIALADLPPDAHVLDVAAGPGTLSLIAARSAERVVAVDFAESMVRMLRQRIAEEGLANVEAMAGDGQDLPFADATFDAAFSMFGLIFFPDRAAGFRELHRVLKPRGHAVVSSWAPVEQIPLLASFFDAIRSLLPGLPIGGGGKAPLSDPDDFRNEMTGAGFRSVEIHTVEHRIDIPSIREFWDSQMRSSAPIALLRAKMNDAEWSELSSGMIARLEGEFGSGPLTGSWPARLGVGVR